MSILNNFPPSTTCGPYISAQTLASSSGGQAWVTNSIPWQTSVTWKEVSANETQGTTMSLDSSGTWTISSSNEYWGASQGLSASPPKTKRPKFSVEIIEEDKW